MTIEEATRREVNRRLARLESTYGEFPVIEETVTNDPEFFEHGVTLAKSGWIGDAGAWVTDEDDRVLMIRHEDDPGRWGVPGGGHEPGETLGETARREVREETGVECSITDVLRARRKIVVLETDPDRRFQMLTAWFEADYDRGKIDSSDNEVLEARWFDEPPDRVHDVIEMKVERWADGA